MGSGQANKSQTDQNVAGMRLQKRMSAGSENLQPLVAKEYRRVQASVLNANLFQKDKLSFREWLISQKKLLQIEWSENSNYVRQPITTTERTFNTRALQTSTRSPVAARWTVLRACCYQAHQFVRWIVYIQVLNSCYSSGTDHLIDKLRAVVKMM